jgi:hypothetical protein
LPFLFNAMPAKADPRCPCGGRPGALDADTGPGRQSQVLQRGMDYLDLDVRPHLPAGQDGRRTTARANGNGERPCRTGKEMHGRRARRLRHGWWPTDADHPGIPRAVAYRHRPGGQRPGLTLSGQGPHSQATGTTERREGRREHGERHAVVGRGCAGGSTAVTGRSGRHR